MKEIELINKRKPREKHFLQEDGTIIAKVYDSDIHYLKDGKYEEIDNMLVRKDGMLTNKSNDYKVEFKDDLKESLMKMKKDEHYIDFKLISSKVGDIKHSKRLISKKNKNVTHNDITDTMSIEYRALANKVKETIILQNANDVELLFELKTNLKLNLENNEIISRDDNGNIIFIVEKPFMLDSNNIRNDNIHYTLEKINNKYLLKLILDDEWLNQDDRKFPVYIDPTITNNGQNINLYDTYIYPGDTDDIRNNKAYLKAGVESIDGNLRPNRTLIKFSLPTIGTGSEIVYASLDLVSYPTQTEYPEPQVATIHRITADWAEDTANWENMSDKFEERVESMFYGSRSTISGNIVIPEHSMYDGNITNLVKKWYRDTPNYGVMIKAVDETNYLDDDFPMFYSKDNSLSTENNPKPIFVLTYRNHNGLESYLDYKKQIFTDGTAYVNTYNGNFTALFDLGHTIGGNLPIHLKLVYNTNDVVLNNKTFFQKGYRLNYEQSVKLVQIDNENFLEYIDADGTTHYFYNQEGTTNYKAEDGLNLIIEKAESDCTMKDIYGNKMLFSKINDEYKLTKITDLDGNNIDIVLNDNSSINKIIDQYGYEVLITYQENSIEVTSPDMTTILNYNNGLLTSIETINGITRFEYTSNHIISNITDVTGIKVKYNYYPNSPYRVYSVTQMGLNEVEGESFVLEYGFDSTNILDSNEKNTTLIYNSYGNLLSANHMSSAEDVDNAYSINRTYGSYDNNQNRILTSEVPIRYIKNYLKNTSFERDDNYFDFDSESIEICHNTNEYVSGNRSLQINILSSNKNVEQTIVVPKGKFYTFSGYFKTTHPYRISLSYCDSAGNTIIEEQCFNISDEFVRNDVTIFYDELATSDLKIQISSPSENTLYIDDIQLEEGEVANAFNMIENGNFSEGYSDWDLEAWTYDGSIKTPDDSFSVINFNNDKSTALKVSTNPTYGVRFTKVLPIKGKQGELYTCSFWYKNLGFPGYGPVAGSNVSIYFKPIGQDAEYCIATSEHFNPNEKKWQFFTYRSHAPEDFECIKLVFQIGREANDFFLTNLSLYKDVTSGEYNYDDNGNLVSITDQSNNINIFNYDQNNQLISMTNTLGKNFKYEYDNAKNDRVLNAISSTGISNRIIYNNNGNPITTRISKRYTTNLNDGIYKIRNKGTNNYIKAELNLVLLEENDCSNTMWKLEKNGDFYKIKYAVNPNYSISYRNGAIALDTEDTNNLFQIEKNNDSKNGTYYIKYNEILSTGTIVRFLSANGSAIETSIFSEISPNIEFYIELKDNLFIENNSKYTDDGRFIKSVTNGRGYTTSFVTNPTNGLITSITDGLGNVIEYEYNNKNKISNIIQDARNVSFVYNDQNQLSQIKQDDRIYNFIYDEFLNLKYTSILNNIILATHEYGENNGNLISTTYGNNQSIVYSYDAFNRISKIVTMDNTYRYLYDNNSNLTKIITNDGEIKYQYDIANRLIKYINDEMKISYKYNSENMLEEEMITFENSQHEIKNTYDNEEKLISMMLDDILIEYNYDELYRLKEISIGGTYNNTYEYITNGKKTVNVVKSMDNGYEKYSCEYDANNNKTQILCNGVLTHQYEYNIYNELIAEYNYTTNTKTEYTYDNYGNILNKTTKEIINNSVLESVSYSYNNPTWVDQLSSYNGVAIDYDEIGNPIKYGNDITMSWINGRMMQRYNDASKNLNVDFKYNVNGIRESKVVNNVVTKYYLEGEDIICEKTSGNITYYLYDATGIFGMKYNNQIYYYVKNIHGDIVGILDSNFNKIANYKYDSWGKVLSITDSNGATITDQNHIGIINPFRYRGYYYDKETELYYLNNRYYSSELGRFISADNYVSTDTGISGYNMYAYANNNPMKYTDTSGHGILNKIITTIAKVATYICKKVTKKNTKKQTKKAENTIKAVQQKQETVQQNVSYTQKYQETLNKNATIARAVDIVFPDTIEYIFFAHKEQTFGDWDLKNQKEWKEDVYYNGLVMEAQDLGNFHYGYVGRAMGIDIDTLVLAGGVVQFVGGRYDSDYCSTTSFCDDPRDTYFIKQGAIAYDQEHSLFK